MNKTKTFLTEAIDFYNGEVNDLHEFKLNPSQEAFLIMKMDELVDDRLAELKQAADDLIQAYVQDRDLLIKEINDVAGIAYVHGWKSSLVKEGEAARAKTASAQIHYNITKGNT